MPQNQEEQVRGRLPALLDPMQGHIGSLGLAVAIGIIYFLAARLSLALLTEPDGVAVFWPAAGVSSGVMIALGRRAWAPVAVGTMIATIAANLLGDRNLSSSVCFAFCNAAEAWIVAGAIARYFGSGFSLDRLRNVLGLLVAALVATTISGAGGAAAYKLFHSPAAPVMTIWEHWFASDVVGVITGAPLVIGIAALRRPLPWSEFIEGNGALATLGLMTSIVIFLPEVPWQTVVPAALLFPILLWLAARCRPVYAAAGVFLVSFILAWATIFRFGHFADARFSFDDRVFQAQAVILTVALFTFVLAALFAERKDNEARLARSNAMLERERSNKMMSLAATAATISHEMKQPLTAIIANGVSARHLLDRTPPDLEEARSAVNDVISDGDRASKVLENLRVLFGKADRELEPVDVNDASVGALCALRAELNDHGVRTRVKLAPELPLVMGHSGQLQEVIMNLIQNAIEAMEVTKADRRELEVRTRLGSDQAIIVEVEDSGPGIDPKNLESIFDAFVTTKPHGTGLGLAICHMIMERHGARLSAASDGKRGALFQLSLPARSAARDTTRAAPAVSS
jgi:signal transduction histidine kinase